MVRSWSRISRCRISRLTDRPGEEFLSVRRGADEFGSRIYNSGWSWVNSPAGAGDESVGGHAGLSPRCLGFPELLVGGAGQWRLGKDRAEAILLQRLPILSLPGAAALPREDAGGHRGEVAEGSDLPFALE